MAAKELVLDALAWAGISEPARVARISAMLVRELGDYRDEHTKTDVKEAVRKTSPPYGRGKAVFEAVEKEYRRQLPIYRERKQRAEEWEAYQKHIALRITRLNRAYAAAFGRPPHEPTRSWNNRRERHAAWGTPEYDEIQKQRLAFQQAESARDKGDCCVALTHQDGYVVALVKSENETERFHIATRFKGGEIVRTYLRTSITHSEMSNLVEAAITLGGPKVKAALAKGKRVVTDWVGRRTFIHHDGSDHIEAKVEELPWRAAAVEMRPTGWQGASQAHWTPILVHGTDVRCDPDYTHHYGPDDSWNDID